MRYLVNVMAFLLTLIPMGLVVVEPDKADLSGILVDNETYAPIAYSTNYLRNEWTALTDELTWLCPGAAILLEPRGLVLLQR